MQEVTKLIGDMLGILALSNLPDDIELIRMFEKITDNSLLLESWELNEFPQGDWPTESAKLLTERLGPVYDTELGDFVILYIYLVSGFRNNARRRKELETCQSKFELAKSRAVQRKKDILSIAREQGLWPTLSYLPSQADEYDQFAAWLKQEFGESNRSYQMLITPMLEIDADIEKLAAQIDRFGVAITVHKVELLKVIKAFYRLIYNRQLAQAALEEGDVEAFTSGDAEQHIAEMVQLIEAQL